jgi:hypothetical protein
VSNSELNVIIVERYLLMTKKEAAIVSAYTGFLLCPFPDLHEYIEKVMGRPVWTHEMASKEFQAELHEKTRADFISIKIEG